ncbi:squamosa promoter-binding protein 15 [Actinacidiphila bryophytorum]|uniref:Squamosa promoter-binding protein 15 n=1 Tax=Actinacidiphila bryophytorum TaxID=1436133 RepID=A0A9W4H4B9_9ACTN|nr:squamosa promoter-binding protein 15 [Actinacidiphila bryophytorum]MBM9435872.1 squamosa promoter-binding protein 15 [Actinacidiphila bryophytorum]MBN6543307.1 squamosa promoter-binding protein 15 [Actinacidiphila bryophytorum]CAG7649793.1 Squamosa promoter-binding protein 15 [Actinacidiphila bryophytorum]
MGWVANVMVSVDMADNANMAAFNDWLRDQAPRLFGAEALGVGFLRLTTSVEGNEWGGWKMPECEVWAGALNNADLPALRRRFTQMPWREPNVVQLMTMDQEEGFFRLWMLRDGQLRQYAPQEPDETDEGFYRE